MGWRPPTRLYLYTFMLKIEPLITLVGTRVNSGYFGQRVNSDIRLQTVEIQMGRLLI